MQVIVAILDELAEVEKFEVIEAQVTNIVDDEVEL